MKKLKRNHRGSALVTVIVVIAFISILATTLLYVTGTNYQMKVSDSKTKESFYITEMPLDMIKADMIKMVSETVEDIYPTMMYSMGARISADDVQVTYENMFLDTINTKVQTYVADITTNVDADIDTSGITVERESGQLRIKGIVIKKKVSDYTNEIATDVVIVPPTIAWPWEYAVKSAGTPSASPVASPVGSASPAASASPASDEVNYYKCVYYENWERK